MKEVAEIFADHINYGGLDDDYEARHTRHLDAPRRSLPANIRAGKISAAPAAQNRHRLTVLSNEKRFLFSAAAHAERAVAYLHDLQPKTADIEEAA